MLKNIRCQQVEDFVRNLFATADTSRFFYHNLAHTCEVVETVARMSIDLSEAEQELLHVAAWLHDVGYLYTYHEHEEKGMALAQQWLPHWGFEQEEIEQVVACIESTKLQQTPRNLLEAILSDADIAFGVTAHFFERGGLLRQEWAACLNKAYTNLDWEKLQLNFLPTVLFYSPYGQQYFAPIVSLNLKKQLICVEALTKE